MQLRSLTGLRGLAAISILMFHIAYFSGSHGLYTVLTGSWYVGVSFFFVLSGFVLAWSHRPGTRAVDFYGRRFARIWPLHAVLMVIAALMALAFWSQLAPRWSYVLVYGTLVQGWIPGYVPPYDFNGVSWSIGIEFFFYALFPVLIGPLSQVRRLRRTGLMIFGAMASVAVAVTLGAMVHAASGATTKHVLFVQEYLLYYFPPFRLGEFALGILLATAVKRGWRPGLGTGRAAGLCLLGMLGTSVVTAMLTEAAPALYLRGWIDLALLPLVALLIAAGASDDLAGRSGPAAGTVMQFLGRWSFALYMCHYMCFRLITSRYGHGIAPLLLATVLSLLGAAVLHHLIETPCERFLRRRLTRLRTLQLPVERPEPATTVTSSPR